MAWIELALAMALFLASHRIPAALGVKGRLLAALGPRGYGILFSVASVLLLWWLISAAGRAPFVPLWDQEPWHRWAANIVMPFAIALAIFGIAAPNPFAFEGRRTGFNPARPGIAGLTRQPLLWPRQRHLRQPAHQPPRRLRIPEPGIPLGPVTARPVEEIKK